MCSGEKVLNSFDVSLSERVLSAVILAKVSISRSVSNRRATVGRLPFLSRVVLLILLVSVAMFVWPGIEQKQR